MNDDDNFINDYIKPYLDYFELDLHICVENAKPDTIYTKGRVTDILKSGKYKLGDYEYYICGHPNMTQAVLKYLRNNGISKIYW